MRSIDERSEEVNRSARSIRERRAARRMRLAGVTAACACAALAMTRIPDAMGDMGDAPFGSLIATGRAPGYVVVGLPGFLLGVAVTIFCERLRTRNAAEWRNGQPHEGRSACHE